MPAQWMCPSCAKLVARRDKFCDHCNTDLRKSRAQRVQGTKTTLAERLRSAWVVWLLASAFFFLFAHVATHGPALARAYMWTLIASIVGGKLLVLLIKASEGATELFYFCLDSRWFFRDDPLDKWVCVFLAVFLEGLAFSHVIIKPAMPPGVSWFP